MPRLTPTPEQHAAIERMASEPTRAVLNCKECSNKAIKRGLCQTHYLKEWYGQKTDLCFADKCERPAWSKGMCLKHYKRQWRHGSVNTTLCAPNDCPVEERLSRVGWTETKSGCWEWRGRRLKGGYGQLDFEGKGVQAHRIAYETWVGEIPKDLIVRHKCDNPPCINPDHLETGTYQDNADDMVQRGRHNPVRGTKKTPTRNLQIEMSSKYGNCAQQGLSYENCLKSLGCLRPIFQA